MLVTVIMFFENAADSSRMEESFLNNDNGLITDILVELHVIKMISPYCRERYVDGMCTPYRISVYTDAELFGEYYTKVPEFRVTLESL